eukprot:8439788-Pyramimonas_sp.AAC.1
MPALISDVAIQQIIDGRYSYNEQHNHSGDWEDTLIKKLRRLPEVSQGEAWANGRSWVSNLQGAALKRGKMLRREFVNGPSQM